MSTLGENLRLARLRRDLSSAQVAERAGVARTTLVRLEHGDDGVSLASLIKVLFVLGLDADLESVSRDDAMGRRLQDLGLLERKRSSKKKA
ncbi:MAG TPA: helix-turn-helix transcriptional regulator [Fibrobacteria bacterium]|nr:helix-turn-helix transcriptional regulator [Fibrobacteria bacterium]